DIGNQGAHAIDICRWALGEDRAPRRVISIGGRFGYDDDAETANTQLAFFDYEKAPLIFEVRGLPMKSGMKAMDHYRGARVGIVIECENGYFSGGVGGGAVYDKNGEKIKSFKSSGGGGHSANFLKAVRSRKSSDLNAHIPKGHVSASLGHMANISHRLGSEATPEEIRESLKTMTFVPDRFEQLHKHLEANTVDPSKTRITLGAGLQFDPETEKFTGTLADEANTLATRHYREPFTVSDKV
ncbi:MAG: gfo/Idh/MocA family oxidoreductase, partial [Kiritimatiellae bacterium]|nr:gfo/Idh/MocA family oxidoreductase [Kiritimatiellia bacterium]